MLLAVDIGNSRIKFGVFDHDKLLSKISVPTKRDLTSDRLARVLADKFPLKVTTGIVCSVVPEVNEAVLRFVADRSGIESILVTNDLDFGLAIDYRPLGDLGTDRLVNSFSAAEKYGVPCIICSFGTALTMDHVNAEREFVGGLIGPGMGTLVGALKSETSQLPEVELIKPEKFIQNTTVGGVQSGIFYGYLGLAERLLAGIKAEADDSKVVATGGCAAMIAENTGQIDVVDNDLTLDGLRRLYDRLQR